MEERTIVLDWTKPMETRDERRVLAWCHEDNTVYPYRVFFDAETSYEDAEWYTADGSYYLAVGGEVRTSRHDLHNVVPIVKTQPFSVEQHPITGAAINEAKELGAGIEEFLGRLEEGSFPFFVDLEWTQTARTQLQLGFMSLVRAIAQPEGF